MKFELPERSGALRSAPERSQVVSLGTRSGSVWRGCQVWWQPDTLWVVPVRVQVAGVVTCAQVSTDLVRGVVPSVCTPARRLPHLQAGGVQWRGQVGNNLV